MIALAIRIWVANLSDCASFRMQSDRIEGGTDDYFICPYLDNKFINMCTFLARE